MNCDLTIDLIVFTFKHKCPPCLSLVVTLNGTQYMAITYSRAKVETDSDEEETPLLTEISYYVTYCMTYTYEQQMLSAFF